MTNVDSKVVEMKFDNKQFESNIQRTIKSLDSLQAKLDTTDSTKGLTNIDKAARNVNLSPLVDAVSGVKNKFSVLETIAVGAMLRIGAQAVELGEKLIKNLSVDNISAGWEKFGEKTTSVATLISQGYDLNEVNKQLNRLNWFTDETSYNFTDMVNNIAKFTASGKDLNESVDAMQGIANWAALSGQNAQTASHAMYQLSQAMGAGSMRLEDYKSIQNVSMDTDEFRQKALDAAVALGTLKKNSDGTYSSLISGAKDAFNFTKSEFATTLTGGKWFTSDVMMSVFKEYGSAVDQIYKYSEKKGITASEAIDQLGDKVDKFGLKAFKAAQEARTFPDVIDSVKDAVSTGWMQTFELIFGNYEEAKSLWTDLANELYDVFAEGGNVRNEMLEIWHDNGGRKAFVKALWNTFYAITDVVNVVKDAFHDIFPPMTAKRLINATKSIEKLTAKFKMSDETSDKLRRTFKGVFAVLDIGKQMLSGVISGIKKLLSPLKNLDYGLLDITSSVGDWLVNVNETLKKNKSFKKMFESLADTIIKIVTVLKDLPKKFNDAFKSFTGVSITEVLSGVLEFVKVSLAKLKNLLSDFSLSDASSSISKKLKTFFSSIKKTIEDSPIGVVLEKLSETVKKAVNKIKDAFKRFKNVDTNGITELSDDVEEKTKPLQKVFDKLKSIFDTIASVFKKAFSTIKKIAEPFIELFKKLFGAIADSVKQLDFEDVLGGINSGSIAMIALGIKKFFDSFSDINTSVGGDIKGTFKSIKDAVGKISGILDGVRGTLEAYQNNIKSKTLLTIASAIAILTASLVVLASIDQERLGSALAVVTAEFGELIGVMNLMPSGDKKGIKGMGSAAKNLVLMSIAILILSSAVKKLAVLDTKQAMAGTTAITGLLAALTVVAKQLSNTSERIAKGAANLIAFAIAIRLLVKPVKELGKMDPKQLIKGLLAVGELMGTIAVFLKLTGKDKIGVSNGAGILILAEAIKILAKSVKSFGDMDPKSLVKGLLAVAAILGELAAFTKISGDPKHMISMSVGLTILGAALKIFANVIDEMGNMDPKSLITGLLGMGAALGIIAAAMKLMPKSIVLIAPSLVIVGAAINIIAKALDNLGNMTPQAIAKSIITLGAALGILAVALRTMKKSLSGAAALLVASVALTALAAALRIMSTFSIGEIAKSIITLAAALGVIVIAGAASSTVAPGLLALGGAIVMIGAGCLLAGAGIMAFATGLSELAIAGPAGIAILLQAIDGVIITIPKFAEALGKGIVNVAKVVLESVPLLLKNVETIILNVLALIGKVAPKLIDTVIDIIDKLLKKLADKSPSLVNSGFKILKAILTGIKDNIGGITETVADIITKFLDALSKKLPDIVDSGFKLIISFINSLSDAIKENAEDLRKAAIKLIDSILTAIFTFLGINDEKDSKDPQSFLDIGKKLVMGIINGIGSLFSKLWDIGKKIVNKILSGIKSIAEKIGETVVGTVKQIPKTMSDYWDTLKSVGKKIIIAIKNGLIAAKDKVVEVVGDVVDWLVDGFSDLWDAFVDIGKNIIDGLIEGIKAAPGAIIDAILSVCGPLADVVKAFFEIESPSKVMARLGCYIGEGLAVGIKDSSNTVTKAAENMSEETMEGFSGISSKIADIINSDPNFNPVITPVLDLSNVVAGSNSINDMLSADHSLALAGNATMQMNGKLSAGFNDNKITVNNRDVVEEIRNLRSDMDTMTKSMHRMQIVMDTGALVGQITGPIDAALGRRAIIKGRGI